MVKCTAEKLRRIMDCKRNIRNMSVIGHFYHGKSTLTDSLVAAAGNARMTNTAERGITIKSRAFSLHYAMTNQEVVNEYLINLIDSPGHTEFSYEVTAALRITDGAIVVVDCIEGVCVGTSAVLRQALSEKIHPILTLNKMDKCFRHRKDDLNDDDGEEVYKTIKKVIDMANDIIFANADSDLSDVAFYPNKGNVAFSSGLDGWAFTLADFAKMWAKRLNVKESLLMERLWGENYFDKETKEWTNVNTGSSYCKRAFVCLCYDPIKKIIKACKGDKKKKEDLFNWLEKLGITMKDDEKKLMHEELVKCVMQKLFPAANTLYKMIFDHLPSPETAQKYRVGNLYNGSLDDIYAKAIKECDPEGPLMFYVSKMIPASDKGSFFAFGRVFAGKVSTGLEVKIMGSNYHHPSAETVTGTVICMGTEQETVQDVPCGNIVALVGLDQFITKNATLTNHNRNAFPFHDMKFTVSPVMRVYIECKKSDHAKLVEGLDLLRKSDLMAEYTVESGEHFIVGSGELHLEMCVKDLRLYSRNLEIDVSNPVVFYPETDLEQFLEPFYLVEFQALKLSLPAIYNIINERNGTQFEEMHRPGTPLVNVKALIRVKDSFGLSSAVKDRTYGRASSQCVYLGRYPE